MHPRTCENGEDFLEQMQEERLVEGGGKVAGSKLAEEVQQQGEPRLSDVPLSVTEGPHDAVHHKLQLRGAHQKQAAVRRGGFGSVKIRIHQKLAGVVDWRRWEGKGS